MGRLIVPLLAAITSIVLWRKAKVSRTQLVLLLAVAALCAALLIREEVEDPHEEIHGIAREEGEAELEVEIAGEGRHELLIRIPEETRSKEEIRAALRAAAETFPEAVLGENRTTDKIEWDLDLPTTLGEEASVVWMTDRPEILGWDGRIGTEVSEKGESVLLSGILYIEEESLEIRQELTVYPSREEAAIAERLQAAGDAQDRGESEEYRLPDDLDGRTLTWFRKKERQGPLLAFFSLALPLLFVLLGREQKKKEKDLRMQELERDYPALVERMHLLFEAGLSCRRVFERMAKDHRRIRKEEGKSRPAYEEIARCWYEMENGTDMETALSRFGQRCMLPAYRNLSLLLARTQKRGGALLLTLLEREAQEARETRRRRARAEGEKTTVRLLLPMGLMLVVVLAVLMVPAVMSF